MDSRLKSDVECCIRGYCEKCTHAEERNTESESKLRKKLFEYIEQLEKESNANKPEGQADKPSDAVNHPAHYKREIECIDEMIAVFGRGMVRNFCLLNVWKYRYRAADKNGREDIEKSDWYMKKYLELDE